MSYLIGGGSLVVWYPELPLSFPTPATCSTDTRVFLTSEPLTRLKRFVSPRVTSLPSTSRVPPVPESSGDEWGRSSTYVDNERTKTEIDTGRHKMPIPSTRSKFLKERTSFQRRGHLGRRREVPSSRGLVSTLGSRPSKTPSSRKLTALPLFVGGFSGASGA